MPFIFWFTIGGAALSVILLITGNWAGAIIIFLITGLACGLYEKLDSWGLIPSSWEQPINLSWSKKVIEPSIVSVSETQLPAPIPPSNSSDPVMGTMRVEVTRTEKTVDVWITLSEKAKFVVESNYLQSAPIEENFDGLHAHMANYKRIRTESLADTDAAIAGHLRGDDLKYFERQRQQWQHQDKGNEAQELKHEEDRYKRQHTVTLGTYLTYPHRHLIHAPFEANLYLDKLEKVYLPKIKAILDLASPRRHEQTKRYDF